MKYVARFAVEEGEHLLTLVTTGQAAAAWLLHACIPLKAVGTGGCRWTDTEIAEALDTGAATIHRVRQTFVEQGDNATQLTL